MNLSLQIINKVSYQWNTLVSFSEQQNSAVFRLSGNKGIEFVKVCLTTQKCESLFQMKVKQSGFGAIISCSDDLAKILLNWSHLGIQEAGQILICDNMPRIEQKVDGLCLNNAVFLGDSIFVDYGDKQLVQTNCQLDKVISKTTFQKRIISMITIERFICLVFKDHFQIWNPKGRKNIQKYFIQYKKQKFESCLELKKQSQGAYHITYQKGDDVKCINTKSNKIIRKYNLKENEKKSVCNNYILINQARQQKLIALPQLKVTSYTIPFSDEMIIQNDLKIFTTMNNSIEYQVWDLKQENMVFKS